MTSFFESPERQARLQHIARSWLGTPFHPHAAIKGVGADCVHLLCEIYREIGFFTGYQLPAYTMDGGDSCQSSQVLSWLEAHAGFVPVPGGALQPGDLATFKLARVSHHVGLVLEKDNFIHAIRGYGVIQSSLLDSTYQKRLRECFRPGP